MYQYYPHSGGTVSVPSVEISRSWLPVVITSLKYKIEPVTERTSPFRIKPFGKNVELASRSPSVARYKQAVY